ncbi:hypothetical protein FA13DRAFT_1797878 [Coprinellus micaceus]|uniref:Uncharacterized protein n=1 Tax=Coprinellus micaceus TaxID=71717 RepID=A0A4Y7SP74_COPMI|nr:hypothetical protein FA13DRAFT_1797878 [Coprinellus micaceus]
MVSPGASGHIGVDPNTRKISKSMKYQMANRDSVNRKNAERNRQKRLQVKKEKQAIKEKMNTAATQNSSPSEPKSPFNIPARAQGDARAPSGTLPTDSERFWLEIPTDYDIKHLQKELATECFGSHIPEAPVPLPEELVDFPYFDRFLIIWEHSKQWASIWGGISVWPESLEVLFTTAAATQQAPQASSEERTHEFMLQAMTHAEHGKSLLRLLQNIEGILPSETRALKLLWKMHTDTAVMLATGIATIDARVSVMKKHQFTIEGTGQLDRFMLGERSV